MNRRNFEKDSEEIRVNWFNIAGIVIGAVVANILPWGIAAVNAMAVAAVCYLIGRAVKKPAQA